jgi:hypothetical protein
VLDDLLMAPESIAVFLEMLISVAPHLTVLSICGNESNWSATPTLARLIRTLPLTALHCARCNFAIGGLESVVEAIAECATLRVVSFANLFDSQRNRRAGVLRHLMESATQLQSLTLSNLHLDDFVAIALGVQRSSLAAFRFVDRPIQPFTTRDDWTPLVDIVGLCTSLRSLELTARLPVGAVEAFAAAMESNTRLTQLLVTEHGAPSRRIEWIAHRNLKLMPANLSSALVDFGLALAPLDLPTLVMVHLFEWTDPAYVFAPFHKKWSVLASIRAVWQQRANRQIRTNMQ